MKVLFLNQLLVQNSYVKLKMNLWKIILIISFLQLEDLPL